MTMTMIPDFSSSLISNYGYDPSTETLAVTFRTNGSTYHYTGVSPSMWISFEASESKGSFFSKFIKPSIQGVKQ